MKGGRWGSFLAGAAVLAAVWGGPLPELAPGAFVAHMAMHMGVVAVAAPLLALGVASGPLDPVGRAPRLFAPVPASVAELVVVWGWHAPALHHVARGHAWGLALEQGSFLLVGVGVWLSAFGGVPGDRARAGAGVVGLLLASMHMTLLGALLALAGRPLYHGAADGPPPFGGLTPLEDQHLGGALMLLVGGAVYLAGGLALVVRMLRDRGGEAPRPRASGRIRTVAAGSGPVAPASDGGADPLRSGSP